jgi:4-hydroxybenzoate polyprenyltransferase
MSLVWLAKGRDVFKHRLAEIACLPVDKLPYRHDVVDFAQEQAARGRKVYLFTAADQSIATAVAGHFGFFSHAQGSRPGRNLKGTEKLAAIRETIGQNAEFDYIGDSSSDLPLWAAAKSKLIAGSRSWPSLNFAHRFDQAPAKPQAVIRLLRPHQWLKNLLVFLPAILAHQFTNWTQWRSAGFAFVSMCCCASAVYVLNDALDIQSDRAHPRKRYRPLASGHVSIPSGIAASACLLILAFTVASLAGPAVAASILLYLALTTLYSLSLKRLVAIDVLLLASLYTLRVIVGGIASLVKLSPWLLSLSMFLFLSLALAKRFVELDGVQRQSVKKLPGRGYWPADAAAVGAMGIASGFVAVVVFTLYINGSADALKNYPGRDLLWFVAPLLLYWIMRLWIISFRGELHDDPVLFAAKDRTSWVVAGAVVALGWAATVGWSNRLPFNF